MVDSQLRPNKVTNPILLEAMRQMPRETFLPPPLWSVAYADQDVRLAQGRVLIAPLAFARLAQLLDPVPGERVLIVGSGTGYGAAVLASCGARVTALDQDGSLLDFGRSAMSALGLTVVSQLGAHREFVPESFALQLRPGSGRLVTVLGRPDRPGVAVLGERQGSGLVLARTFDCTTAMLPGFETVPDFQF